MTNTPVTKPIIDGKWKQLKSVKYPITQPRTTGIERLQTSTSGFHVTHHNTSLLQWQYDRSHYLHLPLRCRHSAVNKNPTPICLSCHIRARKTTHSLHSSSMLLLHKPTTRTHFANHAFHCTGPSVWNSLNSHIGDSGSLAVFKSRLKTFLFCQTLTPS